MIRFTHIERTPKKEVLLKMAEDEAKSYYNKISEDKKESINSEPTDPEIRKLLGFPDEEEEFNRDFVMELNSEDFELYDTDYDYITKKMAVYENIVENIIELSWCTLIEKAGGGVLQVKESFEEVYEKLARKNNKH